MTESISIDELFLEVEQCSKYDVVLPKHIAIAVLAKLRAAEELILNLKCYPDDEIRESTKCAILVYEHYGLQS